MPDQPISSEMILGELRGQMREVVHGMNNQASSLQAIGREMAVVVALVRRVDELEKSDRDKTQRLAVLEADKHRREGAVGLVAWMSKNWPMVSLVWAVVVFIAWANGKLGTHL